ncbi:MAG: phosphocholine cytidylyltransferase family protein [Robiginitomaculum sp.]|nr:phosphocholine cytidylyltransferase family protein [Robiginitomaculum sp.]
MSKVKHAVILAAGRGTRLGKQGIVKPKGFIQIGKKTIIEESLIRLKRAGIKKVTLVTGHKAEYYEQLATEQGNWLQTINNPTYADSGSFYSLSLIENVVNKNFLLLESDLIYEQKALDIIQNDPRNDLILLSDQTNSGDEVYVETKENFTLVNMSKDRAQLSQSIAGELVGISKVSSGLFKHMMEISKPLFKKTLHHEYETEGFVRASLTRPISCLCIERLVWSEIDDHTHLQRAKESIYPNLETL